MSKDEEQKQLDSGTTLRVCPECHVAVLYTEREGRDYRLSKCPTCGFSVMTKLKRKETTIVVYSPKEGA